MKGILVDENGELMVKNGSLVIGDCRQDIAERLIISWTGEFKHAPLLGGNIKALLNGVITPMWLVNIKKQLQAAKVNVNDVSIHDQNIQIVINN